MFTTNLISFTIYLKDKLPIIDVQLLKVVLVVSIEPDFNLSCWFNYKDPLDGAGFRLGWFKAHLFRSPF